MVAPKKPAPDAKPDLEIKPEDFKIAEDVPGGAKKLSVKATGAFLVLDPTTSDFVGEKGGEMRDTPFVRDKIADGSLEEI